MFYSKRTKRVIIGFLFLGLTVGLVIVGSLRFSASARTQKIYEEERAAMRVPEPEVVVIASGDRPQTRRYAAQLLPWMTANVPAEVSGRVIGVMVEAGQSVAAGASMVQLDDSLAKITLVRSQANLDETRRLTEESARLLKTRAISESQYRAQVALNRISEAQVAEAREVLARHTIRAPFDGIVNERLVDVGDAINANQPVVELVDLGRLRVEFYVSENDIAAFSVGRELGLQVSAVPGRAFLPTVDFVARSADAETRLFRVEAVLDNTVEKLPGGLQGVVSAEINRFSGLPMVPAAAVRFVGRNSMVWKLDAEGTPVQTRITVGPELDGVYPVFDGLVTGDCIIIR